MLEMTNTSIGVVTTDHSGVYKVVRVEEKKD